MTPSLRRGGGDRRRPCHARRRPAGGNRSADAVLIGPGLDDADRTEDLLRTLLERDHDGGSNGAGSGTGGATIILDAYALGCLPRLGNDLQPWHGRLILTPNPKEAEILLGRELDQLESDVRDIAGQYQAVVSCRGFIAQPPGGRAPEGPELWEITTGHGGLGTSGSGDVLAGAIAGLRARGASDAQAACWNPPSRRCRRQACQQAGPAGIPGPRTNR